MRNLARRQFLQSAGAAVGGLLLSSSAAAKTYTVIISAKGSNAAKGNSAAVNQALGSLTFHNVNTGETRSCPLCVDGVSTAEVQKTFNHIFRDWRNGSQMDMDLGLLNQLSQIQHKLGVNKPINLISGYRSPRTNEMLRQRSSGVAKRSYHTLGKAMDFSIPGVSLAQVRKAALDLQAGGVGYYPASGFVHIDTGPVRRWG